LQIVQHEVAVTCDRASSLAVVASKERSMLTQTSPNLAIVWINLENGSQVLDRVSKLVTTAKDAGDGLHRGNGPRVVLYGMLVGLNCTVKVSL
jgi:hypothetical protein